MSEHNEQAVVQSLLQQGIITHAELDEAKQYQARAGGGLVRALLAVGACTAPDIARAQSVGLLAEPSQTGATDELPAAPAAPGLARREGPVLGQYEVDPAAIQAIPRSVAQEYMCLPLQISENRILVALADPGNVFATDELRNHTGLRVEAIEAPAEEIGPAIEQYYSTQAREAVMRASAVTRDIGVAVAEEEGMEDLDRDLLLSLDQAPVVRLVERTLTDAVKMRASDIHIEPRADEFVIRFRVDGLLQIITALPADLHRTIISRIKILSGMDISESRLPQDGRFATLIDDRPVDLRVSTLPTYWGEKAVLRVLDKSQALVSLNQLGFLPETLKSFDRLLHTQQGMILVTGPTGSGKSTTLYASLHTIKDDTLNITTVEDPIEYEVEGVNQTQVHPRIELNFARALRHILRQDPDIILVGEIRDYETAEMAFRAALTGHLVLATLHTNDAPSAATRLRDMKVEPYLIASCVIGVLAQRLVRRLCNRCKEPAEASPMELERLRLTPEQAAKIQFHRGRGCDQCRNTGYHGRIALYEFMPMSPPLRDLITSDANAAELRRCAIQNGMRTLKYDGLSKVNAGITAAAEVVRVMLSTED